MTKISNGRDGGKSTDQSTVPSVPGSLLYATSRETTQIDIFIAGTDNSIYTAAWDQNDKDQQWKGWWKTI